MERSIPFGVYTIVDESGSHKTVRLNRCEWATDLPSGAICASRFDYDQQFRGFAFIMPDGSIRRWRSASDGDIAALQALLTGNYEDYGLAYALESSRCWRCNRMLTVPASIHRGLGPDCAGIVARENNRFTYRLPESVPGALPVQAVAAATTTTSAPVVKPAPAVDPGFDAWFAEGDNLAIRLTPGSPKFYDQKERVKALGGRWNAKDAYWSLPVHAANAAALSRDLAAAGIRVDEYAPGRFWSLAQQVEKNRESSSAATSDFSADGLADGLELMPFQRAGVAHAVNVGRTIIADEMGLGKFQPCETLVATPEGWQEIGSLSIGDRVIGSTGEAVTVTGVFPQGVKPTYRVTFSDHSSVEAGDEHLWTVWYRRGGRTWASLTLTTEQLRTRPMLGKLDLSKTALYLPMLSGPIQYDAQEPLPIEPYLFGALLANGTCGRGTPVVTYGVDDIEEVRQWLPGVGEVVERPWASHVSFKGGAVLLRELGVAVNSAEKHIPAIYQTATPDERIALLQGLMDADGSITRERNKVTYHTISRSLADDVVMLVEALGGIASVRTYDRTSEQKPVEYQVRMRLPEWVLPFRLARKAERYRPGTHAHPMRTVKSVEYTRDADSVCIAVDAPDRLYVTEHCILTHNTVQALAAIAHEEAYPALIICPASLRLNWRREAQRWVPGAMVSVLGGKGTGSVSGLAQAPKAIVIINYENLGKHDLAAVPWRAIVADEAHYIKEPSSQRSKAVRALFNSAAHARIRLLLTGTPVLNRPVELWPLLEATGHAAAFGNNFMGYAKRYCGARQKHIGRGRMVWDFSGATNIDELHDTLRSSGAMVRRRKEDVLADLPAKRWAVNPLELAEPEVYEAAEADAIRWFAALPERQSRIARDAGAAWDSGEYDGALSRDDYIEQQINLARVRSEQAEQLVRFEALKTAAWRAKRSAVVDWIREFLDGSDKKLIVFGWHVEVVDALAREFGAPRIQGGMTTAEVEEAKRRFQNDPDCRVIVCNIKAGGVGHTLTAASDVAFVELPWTPADLDQAVDRAHRIGQTESVTGWLLTASLEGRETIEDEIAALLQSKRKVVDAVTDGIESSPVQSRSVLSDLASAWASRARARV